MSPQNGFIPAHGGYRKVRSYQKAQIVFDATVFFCHRFLDKRDRTADQMVQAARSGKQNVVEASQASGTSKEMEIKLTNVARLRERMTPPVSNDEARALKSLLSLKSVASYRKS